MIQSSNPLALDINQTTNQMDSADTTTSLPTRHRNIILGLSATSFIIGITGSLLYTRRKTKSFQSDFSSKSVKLTNLEILNRYKKASFFSIQAFTIGTILCVSVGGLCAIGIGSILGVSSLKEFHEKMKETIPKYTPGLHESIRKSEQDEWDIFQKELEVHLSENENNLIQKKSKNQKYTICNNQLNIYLIGVDDGKSECFSVMASIMQFFVTAVDVDASRYWLRALINIATAEKVMVMKVGIDQMFDFQPEQANILDTFEDSIRRYAQGDEELNGFMPLMINDYLAKGFTFFNKKKDMVDIQEMLLRAAHIYDFVAHPFFDVDKKSLEILESYKICCLILVYAIKSLLVGIESNQEHIDPLIPMIRYANADLNNFTNSWKTGEIDQREKLALYTQSIQILREVEQHKQHKLQNASSNPVLVVRDFVRAMLKFP
ncbi:32189_t:CDS:2 [Gigaspora margarita]|uniref:32189_t:CDS:1 n=1 Tax=Gigaspora margarita TaxID=4874 RepID=A0ABN7UFK5_GIGMA|nr:32189_t:CDS:2 [Gigaspora margarita]